MTTEKSFKKNHWMRTLQALLTQIISPLDNITYFTYKCLYETVYIFVWGKKYALLTEVNLYQICY
jgi:hypothetical protein